MLLDPIEFKFQNKPNSAFQAHPITTKVAAASLLAFVLAFGTEFTLHFYSAALLRTALVVSGSFSLAFLASLLFLDA
ncbi:hypothetical protein PVL29_019488 [Vitis rotundifolia]|uniref:Uncharacterized protein n=1 Tax=Vitis rotundifolia TaxID=103349 RepID=A0AA39DDY5_VITRO|nr:hypothetical protein PVL29_019488 [Vitis rotundifolia]